MSKYIKLRNRPKQYHNCGIKRNLYPGYYAGLKRGTYLCRDCHEQEYPQYMRGKFHDEPNDER